MNVNKKKANNQDKMAALRLAEIKATDFEDLKDCANDMSRTASLDSSEALEVAKAIRAKYLPNLAKQAGISDMGVKKLINLEEGTEDTANFANDDTEDDDDMELHHFEGDEDETEEDFEDEEDEVNDSEMAKFEIEVPADMVDAAQQAVQQALDALLSGNDSGDDFDSDEDFDDEEFEDDSEEDLDFDDDFDSEDDDSEMEEDSEQMHKLSNGVQKMSKNALNSRKAEREEILKKLASEEPLVVPEQKYSKNYDLLDGEKPYPTMTMENSGSNSLKEQNPDWAEQKLFTNKMDEIQLKSNFKSFTLPGKTKDLEYTIEFDEIDIPSQEDPLGSGPEIPTQMDQLQHNSTVYKTASEKHAVECVACGHRMHLSEAEMNTAKCPKCDGEKEAKVEIEQDVPVKISANESKKVIALETARIKTAFSCSSKLAVAGIIDANEIDSYADQMLNDGLKADAMIRQTKLLLKSSQTNTERVAAAAAERMQNVRTASTMGISTSPAFSGSLSSNGAALDIQAALKGTWSMPQIED